MATATLPGLRTKKIAPQRESVEILRAAVFHTPKNAFQYADALAAFADGAIAIHAGRVAACGDYIAVRAQFPDAVVRDLRGGCIVPGLIDTHVHFPQMRIIGGLGYSLLDWLDKLALPEEARLADRTRAHAVAREFVHGLVSHGTTTALVFGSHFAEATAELFGAAERRGIRVTSGLVLSDRLLRPELHQTPDAAFRLSKTLIERFHGHARLRYAVTPRFALSASEAMLEVCQSLLHEDSSLTFTTHINENPDEIGQVAKLFPWAADYLAVYEKYDLIGHRSVLAHNVHASTDELKRLAARDASVAHCPCSNAALGSGIFPMRRHLEAQVRFALGTDVGAGTGFSMLKEALQAYSMQRVAPEAMVLNAAQMLWMATRSGAEALSMENEIGDFTPGNAADLVYFRPPPGSTLHTVFANTDEDPERMLAALLTLAGQDCVGEVRVEGDVVFEGKP
jgi:guanine deaminase